ncbi:glycosyltransferase family 2 protein [Ruegeria arenilitoris]|uniref:glycosyltransferase family 2 protein n=1 Tax=Ruegeria arenilitoris TaxID=1173585 RepID=UPI00147B2CDA|nr:glycosyltransferase family 2 protein [Ruegeria arenilitoris]
MKIGLFSCAKDEGPFLLEWVAYHKLVGFTDIVIYSNDSTDGTTELLDALDASGALSHVLQNLADDQVPQNQAAELGFDHEAFEHADWLMWLDSDEFLFCVNAENSVVELIKKIEPIAAGMAVNWLNFGDSGFAQWSEGLVTQKFLHRSETNSSRTFRFKTLFKKTDKTRGFGLHRPFFKWGYQESDGKFINAAGQGMHDLFYRAGGGRRHRLGDSPPDLVSHDWASIFHYAVKTKDSFGLKKQRGQGTKAIGAENRSSRFRDKYWDIFNRNEVYDPRMLEYRGKLKAKISDLLADETVYKAHENCIEHYRKKLAQLKSEKATSENRTA